MLVLFWKPVPQENHLTSACSHHSSAASSEKGRVSAKSPAKARQSASRLALTPSKVGVPALAAAPISARKPPPSASARPNRLIINRSGGETRLSASSPAASASAL